MKGDGTNARTKIPPRVEQSMLEILTRPGVGSDHADSIRRDLRALFLQLEPQVANAVLRRLDSNQPDDVLVNTFRSVIEPRHLARRRSSDPGLPP